MTTLEVSMQDTARRLRELQAGQLRASEQVERTAQAERDLIVATAATAAAELKAESERVNKLLLEQASAVLAISQSLNQIQTNLNRWGAAVGLVGAVVIFIGSRILGLG